MERAYEALPDDQRDLIDDASAHDRAVAEDADAQRVAAYVADEVRNLVTYMIVGGDVAGLERLAERLGTPGMQEALRLTRARGA